MQITLDLDAAPEPEPQGAVGSSPRPGARRLLDTTRIVFHSTTVFESSSPDGRDFQRHTAAYREEMRVGPFPGGRTEDVGEEDEVRAVRIGARPLAATDPSQPIASWSRCHVIVSLHAVVVMGIPRDVIPLAIVIAVLLPVSVIAAFVLFCRELSTSSSAG